MGEAEHRHELGAGPGHRCRTASAGDPQVRKQQVIIQTRSRTKKIETISYSHNSFGFIFILFPFFKINLCVLQHAPIQARRSDCRPASGAEVR